MRTKFTQVMIDFETFGNGKNACVVQIGAVWFDLTTGLTGQSFSCNIDAEDAVRNGAQIDASTVYWWLQQSEAARKSIGGQGIKESLAFNQFNTFLQGAEEVWSHATFDFVILTETLKRLGIKPNFHYRAARDIRTLLSLSPSKKEVLRDGTHHNGLDDSMYQVKYCHEAWKALQK